MVAASMQAQKGKISVGGGLAYGTEIKKMGINLRGYYGITDKIDAAPSFTYFFPNKEDYLEALEKGLLTKTDKNECFTKENWTKNSTFRCACSHYKI